LKFVFFIWGGAYVVGLIRTKGWVISTATVKIFFLKEKIVHCCPTSDTKCSKSTKNKTFFL